MITLKSAKYTRSSTNSSVYPAIIVNMAQESSENFVLIQVYVPSVMSGTVQDAKYTLTNWVSAPKKKQITVNGELQEVEYDYAIGGVVMVSYENGDPDAPQFVNYIEISEAIRSTNEAYVNGADINKENNIFDLMDPNVTMDTPGLQKALKLLPALKACAPGKGKLFHTFGYEGKGIFTSMDGKNYLTIFRCGEFGSELVLKKQQNLTDLKSKDANFDYLENNSSYAFYRICKFLLQNEKENETDKNLISIVNNAVYEFEEPGNNKFAYDKTNAADRLFWYTKLAGYAYTGGNGGASLLSSSLANEVADEDLQISQMPKDYEGYNLPNVSKIDNSLYLGNLRTMIGVNSSSAINFINTLWKRINNNSTFNTHLTTRYAIIISNNLYGMRISYNVKDLTSKTLMVCAVIASAFPVLEKTILNLGSVSSDKSYDNNDIKTFAKKVKESLEGDDFTKLPYSESDMAKNFRDMYFMKLGWPNTGLYENTEKPADSIYNYMLAGINYIKQHYDDLADFLKEESAVSGCGVGGAMIGGNPSAYGLTWPFKKFKLVTSPFGYRILNGKSDFHLGIDIGDSGIHGAEVYASASGTVVSAEYHWSYGNNVYLKHTSYGSITNTRYAHLLKCTVKAGQSVTQGQVIGYVDNTGSSFGSHLHYEVYINGKVQNPLNYVNASNIPGTVASSSSKTRASSSLGGCSANCNYDVPLSSDVLSHLCSECNKYKIDPALMLTIISCESGFQANADNGYAAGLCQVARPYWSSWCSKVGLPANSNILDPKANITVGVYIFKYYLDMVGGTFNVPNVHKALMCYSEGEGNALPKINSGITSNFYSQRVVQRWQNKDFSGGCYG